MWATVAAQPGIEHRLLKVPRRGPQAARDAPLALRLCPVTLGPPRHRQREGLPAVALWAVQVQAVDPPTDVQPIAWLLLTTGAVETVDAALERVQWYACRWGMEMSQSHYGSREHLSLVAA